MFFKSFVVPFVVSAAKGVKHVHPAAVHVRSLPTRFGKRCARRIIGVAVQAHLLLSTPRVDSAALAARNEAGNGGTPHRLGQLAIQRLRRVAIASARASLRAAFAGRPLTPGGYAVIAAMVTAVALVALFSGSSASGELETAMRFGWLVLLNRLPSRLRHLRRVLSANPPCW